MTVGLNRQHTSSEYNENAYDNHWPFIKGLPFLGEVISNSGYGSFYAYCGHGVVCPTPQELKW